MQKNSTLSEKIHGATVISTDNYKQGRSDKSTSIVTAQTTEDKIPHLLKYMGSKREIMDFVVNSIQSIGVDSQWFCDLFAGSGVISAALKGSYNVHANDIQAYSSILTITYLSNLKQNVGADRIDEIKKSVQKLVRQFSLKYPGLRFIYPENPTFEEFSAIEKEQQLLIERQFDIGFHLFTKYYSGTYWSFEQCLWIDSIRAVAERYIGTVEYYAILSSLIFAMAYASQSTGHYAQYRGIAENSMADILTYRRREIWPYFEKKFNELISSLNGTTKSHRTTTLDYVDCLRIIEEESIVYADPPYQSVHYSRFYHILETLVRYDYPKLKYKGRYREDRHQSPFCKRTTVNNAFKFLFEGVKSKKAHLVLSYSNVGMISLQEIEEIGETILGNGYSRSVLSKDHVHSKMGRSDERQHDVTEYILLFKRGQNG